MKESLHEAAMRITGKRGCAGGCNCKNGIDDPCPARDIRDDYGVCLIRRIAQCSTADATINWLKQWQINNPPIQNEVVARRIVEWDIVEDEYMHNMMNGTCPVCGESRTWKKGYLPPIQQYCSRCGSRVLNWYGAEEEDTPE